MLSAFLSIILFLIALPLRVTGLSLRVIEAGMKVDIKATEKALGVGNRFTSRVLKRGNTKSDKIVSKGAEALLKAKRSALRAVQVLSRSLLFLSNLTNLIGFILTLITLFIIMVVIVLIAMLVLACGVTVLIFLDKDSASSFSNSVSPSNQIVINQSSKEEGNKSSNINKNAKTVKEKLDNLGNWYVDNVTTYQTLTTNKSSGKRKYYDCDLWTNTGGVGDDCTGFGFAFMCYVSDDPKSTRGGSSSSWVKGSPCSGDIPKGWKFHSCSELSSIDDLQTGDILCRNGHVEVYIDPSTTFGWGQIQKEYPKSTNVSLMTGSEVKTVKIGSKSDYVSFYRYEGD